MLLPKLFKRLKDRSGFTMIELLVVIAVIGVLAVAVLSSINPIEQVNKGRDTRTRSDAAQLLNAIDRFFAIHEKFPWNDAKYNTGATGVLGLDYNAQFPVAGGICTPTVQSGVGVTPYVPGGFCLLNSLQEDNGGNPVWLSALTQTEEVKQGILDRITNSGDDATLNGALFIFKGAATSANDDVKVCFLPTSKAFQDEAVESCLEDYTNNGNSIVDHPAGACPQAAYAATTQYANELTCMP